jgi:hypothetical protein
VSKQLMIYNNVQPLSAVHLKWSVDVDNYAFVSSLNSVPVLASEILLAAPEFPIIFSAAGSDGAYMPLAVMGLRDGENLLLNADNKFTTRYVPAFVRRYPFVLGGSTDSEMMTLCMDADSGFFDASGEKGVKLFEASGEKTPFLNELVGFLQDYHQRANVTSAFVERLHKLNLLVPMSANITIGGKEPSTLNVTGFYVVDREKLKAISDEDALELFKKDGLELIYAHLNSLSNFNGLVDLMSKKMAA